MKKLFSVSAVILLAAGCARQNTPEALGEHNLSKGRCVDIPACQGADSRDCRLLRDESVQYVCEMAGGTFVPRSEKKRRFWQR